MTHTAETVRAACEQPHIILERSEMRFADSGETNDGELWYDGRRIFSVVPDPTAPKATLEEQVRALRDALAPFAAFGEALKLDACEDSDVMHTAAGVRVLAGDYRRAVAALAALP